MGWDGEREGLEMGDWMQVGITALMWCSTRICANGSADEHVCADWNIVYLVVS